MMDRRPIPPERRRKYEALIRRIDLFAYLVVFVGGLYALFATPETVADELKGVMWLVGVWAALLFTGGAVGFAGRLSRYWMIEVPATVLAFFGVVIYVVVLGRFAFTSVTAAVAALLIVVAGLLMARRWAELQIFATDPDAHDFQRRMAEILRRRTQDFPHRHR
jgi:hypothetical protein